MKKILKNLLFGFGGQLLILAMSIILPRFILISFGSEVNGIATTITQIFTYITLLEAGIGNASVNRLYKDISSDDREGISVTLSATKKYFNRIIPIYVLCVAAFCIIYPLVIKTTVSSATIRLIIIVQGLSGVINFYFTNTYTQLLIADGRNYVSSNLTLMVKTVSTIVQILLIQLGFDIVSVQVSLLLAFVLKAIITNIYVKKKYPWLKKVSNVDTGLLEQRGAFIVHEVSGVLFQGTDVFLISIFCSMQEVSVYSIYNMVYVALSGIFTVLFKGIDFNLGLEYNRDREKYIKLHDTYETIVSCFVFAMISAAYMVILPFVKLYTDGVDDVDYIRPLIPILFSLIQLLSSSRSVASKLITISGRAKNTMIQSISETAINIIVSVVCGYFWGIPGVLLGTIMALLYRTNDIIIYANVKILNRRPWYAYRIILINFALFAGVLLLAHNVDLNINSYIDFFVYGVLILIIMFVLFFGIHLLLTRNIREAFINICKKMKNISQRKNNSRREQ